MARSSSRTTRRYKSKVDVWLAALLIVSLLAALCGGIIAAMEQGWLRVAQVAFIMLGVIGLVAWLRIGTHYTLEGRNLIVRSGPFRWTIPVDDIRSIEKATTFMRARSSPALSLDRLRITYGSGKTLMISPAEKEEFLADIKSRQTQAA